MSEQLSDSEFLEMIIRNMVDNPDAVKVDRTTDDKGVLLMLNVDSSDMGKVIGKEGTTAQAIRTILRSKGRKLNASVSVKISEPAS